MKALCLILSLVFTYTSVAYCADGDRRPYIEVFRESKADRLKIFLDNQKNSKTTEIHTTRRVAKEKKNQKEAQRIQDTIDAQIQEMLKARLYYTEQIVNNLIY